ncbi:hypothetical protein [Streptomyces sp. MNU77]|uniref:hypothetical protein n=1 Tax=Streptomyces sp. MNU77 TaxID=1573406 RepID=UPI000D1B4CFB
MTGRTSLRAMGATIWQWFPFSIMDASKERQVTVHVRPLPTDRLEAGIRQQHLALAPPDVPPVRPECPAQAVLAAR